MSAQSFIIEVKENHFHVRSVLSAENVLAMQQSSSKSLRSTLELVMSQYSIHCVYLDYCEWQTDKETKNMRQNVAAWLRPEEESILCQRRSFKMLYTLVN